MLKVVEVMVEVVLKVVDVDGPKVDLLIYFY